MPKPVRIYNRTVWDRRRLDAAFGALSVYARAKISGIGSPCDACAHANRRRLCPCPDRPGQARQPPLLLSAAQRASRRSGFTASRAPRHSRPPTTRRGSLPTSGTGGGHAGSVAAAEARHLSVAVRPILRLARVQAARPAHAAAPAAASSRTLSRNQSRRAMICGSLISLSSA